MGNVKISRISRISKIQIKIGKLPRIEHSKFVDISRPIRHCRENPLVI